MTRQDDIKNLIRNHNRRLQKLKEQQALHGLDAPPKILLEIEDIEAELEQLQTELNEIESDTGTLEQRVEQQRQRIAAGLDEIRRQATEEAQLHPDQKRLPVIGRPPLGVVDYFKNRVRELEQIGRLLAEPATRLVSVIGHGGMGKTALASKVLRDLEQHRWPHTDDDIPLDGIVYLSTRTAGISLERLFLDCAKMLGGESEKKLNTVWTNPKLDTEEKVSHLLEALREGRFVILLDNMEDLLDDKGQLVDEDLQHFFDHSLTAAHGAQLLVTSRLALAFGREVMRFDRQVKLLEGLPTPDGVALLRELDPNGDYGLQDAPEEQLAQAVELVYGVPRALEVMAGILANDPFASLAEVMEQFYEQEDVVQALIEENYKRLDDNARRVIEALAVFKRPIPPLAVDYLLEPFVPGLDVPGIVRRLMRTNIISIDRATKTVALHPIDQDYAYSQLPEEGIEESAYTRQALERRAADYYAQLRKPQKDWKTIDELEPQLVEFEHRVRAEDYNRACEILEPINDYLYLWGHYARLVRLREQLVGRLTDLGLQAANLNNLGSAYHILGQIEQAIEFQKQALTIARKIDDKRREGIILGKLGFAYRILGQIEHGIKSHKDALDIFRNIEDGRLEESTQLGNLGLAYRNRGQFEQAIKFFEQAIIIARETDDPFWNEGIWLGHLGDVYYAQGQVAEAIRLSKKALVIARKKGDRRREGHRFGGLGLAYHSLGQIEQAIDSYREALAITHQIGDHRAAGFYRSRLGNAYQDLGQIEQSIDLYKESLIMAHKIGDRPGQAFFLGNLGSAYRDLGQLEKATEFYEAGLDIARELSDDWEQSRCLLRLGKVLLAMEKLPEAQLCCTEARVLNVPWTSYQAALALGIVFLHQHDLAAEATFVDTFIRCQAMLDKTAGLYEPHHTLATALVGQVVCKPHWSEEDKRPELLAPALTEYQRALQICAAPGVVQDAIRNLELIQAAGIEGLEPVFELLEGALERDDN